ncbi:hypothetical protein E4V99_14030 [Microbacterium sp. dk485]|uniref:hypothetical protein n=1 Tax=Microbacterium sp. dk485 TaxID=2560021 RepID=UPI0010737C65|nr:hypothetical protein [Microbacterium sp. dk485]TFV82048.1 hypothetical protein E4V99_14030 [Microbacterium sp. dk485]
MSAVGEPSELTYIREDIAELREDIRELRRTVTDSHDNKVSHREWAQRNDHVNGRLQGLGREIGDLRAELRAKSAPWWSVCAVIVAGLSFAWSVIKPF